MEPRSYTLLSPVLRFTPKLEGASFEEHALNFNTTYKGEQGLIPVSVDADQYLDYKMHALKNSSMQSLVSRSINDARRGNKRQGLSIGVALPKRFDQFFGEGGGNLRVSGYRRITFSGRSQWTDGQSELFRPSKFPSLNMEQVYRFDITGTIGSKISVKVSEDSQTDIPLANRLQLRYKGDEDDILKVVEAGNTNLQLPNTRFVGYSSRIQGLFGIKAEAQVGNLRLIGIASQEKGSSERSSVTASGEENAEYIRDYNYVENRIFDLGYPGEFSPFDSVVTLYVYESVPENDQNQDGAVDCILQIYPDSVDYSVTPPVDPYRTQSDSLRMVKLDDDDYRFYNQSGKPPYVVFSSSRPTTKLLGCWMIVRRYSSDGSAFLRQDTVGSITGNDPNTTVYHLKSLRTNSNDFRPSHKTWGLMWRNCYRIPKGVSVDDIDLRVYKGLDGTENNGSNLDYQEANNKSQGYYITILGLDQYNRQSQKQPDNVLDDRRDVFNSDEWGLLVFPNRKPFDSDTTFTSADGETTTPLAVKVAKLYDYESPTEKTQASKYYLKLATKTRSSIIRLNRANIIEGSEQVRLNGVLLTRDQDYKIDYDFGQVTLLNADAIDPNADLDIDFEYAPFLALQKKTLLGMRAEYEWSKNLKFGSTYMYKSDKAQDRKPRVGQETAKMSVVDFDLSFNVAPHILTTLANAVPLVSTEAQSNMSVSAEVAQSRPNPNVDNVAYIDDFESSRDQLSLGTVRSNWTLASKPEQVSPFAERSKILWHNPINGAAATQVYEGRDVARGEGTIATFRMVFRPRAFNGEHVQSWGGIMRYYGNRVDSKRAQLIEIRLRGKHGKMHLDFGKINEDVNGDGTPQNEDADNNGVVDEAEDLGLDILADEDEPGYDPVSNPDPDGDDYYFLGEGKCPVSPDSCEIVRQLQEAHDPRYYYEWLNGTEGNRNDLTALARPDEEKLSQTKFEENNAYFSYVIDLASDSFLVDGSENQYGWRTYRIPIRDSLALDTIVTTDASFEAKWSDISHVRVWFEGDEDDTIPDTVEVAEWYFVQSNWEDTVVVSPFGVSNSAFVVATLSEEDGTFQAPPGVTAYEDLTSGVTETQRGLGLIYSDLRYRDTCLATKDLITIEQYSGYRNLEMYVHGDDVHPDDSVMFFFRLGQNDSTFYEYRSPTRLYPGWDPRNYVNIDFNEITALKDSAQRALPANESYNSVDVTSGKYHIRGNPNINQIRYYAAGVINPDPDKEVSGEVWLDELRVTNVRRDVGTAGRVTVTGNMADLVNYGFSYEYRDPYFRGISAATRGGSDNNLGSGRTEKTMSYNASLQLHKFLPRSVGARIPISVSYNKSTQVPLLRTGSDIVLPEEVRQEEQSISETKSFRVSEAFQHKGRHLLYDVLLNRQTFSFSYSRSNQTSVNRPYVMGENYNVGATYDMGISKPPTVPIFFWTKPIPILKKTSGSKLSLFPNQWRWDAKFNRSLSISDDINNNRVSSLRRDFTGTMNLNYKVLDNLTTSYNYSTKRDLSDPDLVTLSLNPKKAKLGIETNYAQNFGANYDPRLFSFVDTRFTYAARYNETYERSTRSYKSDLSSSWNVGGSFQHLVLLGGKSGGQTRRRTGPHRNPRGETEKDKDNGKPFYDPPLAVLRFMTGWIRPVAYKYATTYNASVPGLTGRPIWRYRFGLERETDVERVTDPRAPYSNESQSYEFSSGFTFLGGLDTDVRFKRAITQDIIRQNGRTKSVSTGWPDLGLRIQRFETLPLIKSFVNKFIDIFAPRTSYSRSTKETFNLEGGFLTRSSETKSFSPLLSVNFRLLRALSFSGSYTYSKSNDKTFNPTDGRLVTETQASRKSIAFTSQYSFSAPGGIAIPLFGKLKFQSEVSININVKQNSNQSETSSSGGPFVLTEDKSDFTVQPVISYTFSRQVKGGLSARWQDSNDNYRNRKSHIRELQIWAEIRF